MKVKTVGILVLLVLASSMLSAVTFSTVDYTCPVCGVVNQFQELCSYGSYVYARHPVEIINWPFTTSFCWYMCNNCYYTDFMSTFDSMPKKKSTAVRDVLDNAGYYETFEDYKDVPVSRRLEMVGTVWSVLEKDDEDWLRYYLSLAYHYNLEGQKVKANIARKKVVEVAVRMFPLQCYLGLAKKLLLTSGAMKYLLGDNKGALKDFKKALKYTFYHNDFNKEQNERYDQYYSVSLEKYIDRIKNPV